MDLTQTTNTEGDAVSRQADVPPMITASWLRKYGPGLTGDQVNGWACVFCHEETAALVPVGRAGTRRLVACLPPCAPALGQERP
jgi:hypothetical protein